MTATEELAFWREMATAAEVTDPRLPPTMFHLSDRLATWEASAKTAVIWDALLAEGVASEPLDCHWRAYDWPPRRAFIARQIARLEREIAGGEQ